MQPEENSNSLVWQSFISGDKEAFAQIYNLYLNELYRYGTKLCMDESLVKDAIQEVYIDLYLKRERNHCHPGNLKFYLILALKRNLIKKLKFNRRIHDMDSEYELLFEPVYSIEKIIVEQEEDEEKAESVIKALNQIPPKQKEAVYLRFNESLEYSEIAEIMGISVESVRKQVYRALKTVRDTCERRMAVMLLHSAKNK